MAPPAPDSAADGSWESAIALAGSAGSPGAAGQGASTGFRDILRRAAAAQEGRTFLWTAPALAAGIGLYFSLPAEPSPAAVFALLVPAAALAWAGRARPPLLLAGIVVLGVALGGLRSLHVATPLIRAGTGEVAVSGEVMHVERSSPHRWTLVLAPRTISGMPPEALPRRLRLSFLDSSGRPPVGARIAFSARLVPLPAPVAPDAFDYGRSLWFDRIGGLGRITSPVTVEEGPSSLWAQAAEGLVRLRLAMGARIHAALAEPYGSFAEALITGERSAIPPEINRSLLVSGLFHILSISGLHMWLVAGGVFWMVRAALALVPGLALTRPIKKWAAGAAVLTGLFYMLLADSGAATARSFVMIAVVLFAVMVDRPALATRNLAVAALILLALEPEAAAEAGFQMSFLAVLGLVALHEALAERQAALAAAGGAGRGRAEGRHWLARLAQKGVAGFAASLATSLVAGLSSTIPAAYHFGRISPYGVLANGLAIPVVGIVVMPAALAAAVAMPFGLEYWPLQATAWGLELVVAISDRVAALPGADVVAPRPPAIAAVLAAGGLLLLCLLRGPVRAAGAPLILAGLLLAARPEPVPDLLVEASGQNVALRTAEGLLVPAHPRRARFAVGKWLQANGEEESPATAARRPGWTCSGGRCTALVKGRRTVYLSRMEGQPPDCAGASIVIADFPLRGACRLSPVRIDRFDLWRSGAHALRITPDGVETLTARAGQGARPWVVRPLPRRKAVAFGGPR